MATDIIKIGEDKYAVFQTITDAFILDNASAEEVIEFMARRAYEDTKFSVELTLKHHKNKVDLKTYKEYKRTEESIHGKRINKG